MSFAAKYPGQCTADDCRYGDSRINVGDEVEYVDDDLVHTSCAAAGRRADSTPTCRDCGLQHRGECY